MNSNDIFAQTIGQFIQDNFWIIAIVYVWSLTWKAIALWKSARQGQGVWFGVFLVVNTLGLLEILYIYHFSKQQLQPKAS